jgi:tripartite-type tricarboxylate transporter receptor subunit TctC
MRRRSLLALAAASLVTPAAAQERYPSRPVTIVIPFPPGGVADQTARPLAAALERQLGQPFVLRNVPAAAGAVGMAQVANARPDGYTLLMALSSISIIPEADKLFNRQPAYAIEQLVPVARLAADPTVLVVRGDSPWRTLQDFIADARARPGAISFSSSGVYGTLHTAMAMFAAESSLNLRHVPFAGGGPAVTALLGGNVDALASGPGPVLAQIRAGQLRALANWGAERIASLPDVPTFRELGHRDVEFYIWAGLFAPTRTPAPIMTQLREAVRTATADPELVRTMNNIGSPLAYLDAPEFQAFWDADARRLAAAVQRIGRVE